MHAEAAACHSVNQITRKWERQKYYGGRAVENATQATGRDFLTHAMKLLDRAGLEIVLHVHDEVVLDARADQAQDIKTHCETRPAWAGDFPLAAEVKTLGRWGK